MAALCRLAEAQSITPSAMGWNWHGAHYGALAEVNYGCVKPYQKMLAFIGVADSDRTLAKLMGPVRGKAEVRLVPSAWQRIIRPRKISRPPLRASRRLPPMVP